MLLDTAAVNVVQIVRDGGTIGLLTLAVLGSVRKWWVPGWLYEQEIADCDKQLAEMREDRNEWRGIAERGAGLNERNLTVAEAAIRRALASGQRPAGGAR